MIHSRLPVLAASLALAAAWSARANALQPLAAFVQASRDGNPDLWESRANAEVAAAAHQVDLGRQLPSVTLKGSYTRNQYGVVLPLTLLDPTAPPNATLTLTPVNQWDFNGTLQVPLVDVASFWRIRASGSASDAAERQDEATHLQVIGQVVQDYFQLVANLALVRAAQRAKDVAQASRDITQALVDTGRAPILDADRAAAEVERQTQLLAQAQLAVTLSTRALQSVSGLTPQVSGAEQVVSDDLHAEAAEATFAPPGEGTPAMAAATLSTLSAQQQARAARLQLIPALSGVGLEHTGNYPGFSGQDSMVTGILQLQWQLDYTTFANWHLEDAQLAASKARQERVDRAAADAIHATWAAVQSALARSQSARVEEQASRHAAALAQDRYQVGAATQLDNLQADRDAFAAEVARIQADADLANARIQLRLAAGRDPFTEDGAAR